MDKNHRIINDGAIAIDEKKIVGVGKTQDITKKFRGEVVIDAKHKAVLPGFVNVHTHAATVYLKGVTEDMLGALHQVLWPIKHLLNKDILYDMSLIGLLELLRSGSTTVAENYNMIRIAGAKAVEKIGVRAYLSEQVIDADLNKIEGASKTGFTHTKTKSGKKPLTKR